MSLVVGQKCCVFVYPDRNPSPRRLLMLNGEVSWDAFPGQKSGYPLLFASEYMDENLHRSADGQSPLENNKIL